MMKIMTMTMKMMTKMRRKTALMKKSVTMRTKFRSHLVGAKTSNLTAMEAKAQLPTRKTALAQKIPTKSVSMTVTCSKTSH